MNKRGDCSGECKGRKYSMKQPALASHHLKKNKQSRCWFCAKELHQKMNKHIIVFIKIKLNKRTLCYDCYSNILDKLIEGKKPHEKE